MRSFRLALILAALATPAFADYLRIVPPAPDSEDVIVAEMGGRWRDLCIPRNPTVTRNGNTISIALQIPDGPCPAATAPWDERVTIGTLPPGSYSLSVFIPSEPILTPPWMTIEFPVTQANASHTITPNVGPVAGGTEVTIIGSFGSCPIVPPCINPQVLFGGVQATSVHEITGGVIAVTPPHAPGIVDVELRGFAGTTVATLPSAYTFHGLGVPDPSAYTPLLIPLIFQGPGAFGSQWFTEAIAYNESETAVTPLNPDVISTCPPNVSPCPSPAFAAKSWAEFHHGPNQPAGAVVWIPRSQEKDLHFALHVRDLSRATDHHGTEIPVVREHELLDAVHLLNVPVTSGFRHTLRVYDLGFTDSRRVSVAAYSPTNELIASTTLDLSAADEGCLGGPVGCTPNLPRYGTVSDIVPPAAAGSEAIRLEIRSIDTGMRLWAFVSVTNNSTQQITTITPQ
jgi:hypothetical protein